MMAQRKIVVVTSDAALLEFVRYNLGEIVCQIADTEDGGEVLRGVILNDLADLVVIDIVMPSLDGLKVCLDIRQWSEIPIIMLSTWGAERCQVRGLDLTADDHLSEPFGIAELTALIEESFGHNDDSVDLMVVPAVFCLN